MAIMKRDINFGLFILIIVTLVCFVAFTIYFQENFKKVALGYKEKLAELEKVTSDLLLHKSKLNETSYELKVKVKRESELGEKYTELKEDRDTLQNDLESTKKELSDKKAELTAAQIDLENTKSALAAAQSSLRAANTKIDSLETRIDTLEDELDECGS